MSELPNDIIGNMIIDGDIDRTPATPKQVAWIAARLNGIRHEFRELAPRVSSCYRYIDDMIVRQGLRVRDLWKHEASGLIDGLIREQRSGEHRTIAAQIRRDTCATGNDTR